MVDAILREICTSGMTRGSIRRYSIFTQIVFATQCEETDDSYRLYTCLNHRYREERRNQTRQIRESSSHFSEDHGIGIASLVHRESRNPVRLGIEGRTEAP